VIFLFCLGAFVAFILFVVWVQPLWIVPLLERLTPQVTYRVRTNLPLVGLSFDDGPHPDYTPQALEILQRHNARATFFLIGDRALRYPEIVAQIKSSGNEAGNHYFYTRMGTMMSHSDEEFLRNLERVEQAIGLSEGSTADGTSGVSTGAAAGVKKYPKLFRAPGGIARPRQLTLARERGYTPALGCAYPHDPGRPPLWYIRWLVAKNLKPGTIIILHDGIKNPTRTIEALPHILREAEKLNLRVVSIGELLAASNCG
jgi:peptidoglycan-N-acetylglucosamine deacetylase